jgi:hypothetical protein
VAATVAYRTSKPVRQLLFGLGSVLTVLLILWGSARALDELSIREQRSVKTYAGVTAVDLRSAHGDVHVVRSRGSRVRVTVDSRSGLLGGGQRQADFAGGELRLRGGCHFVTIGTCDEDYRIALPAGLPIAVRTTAGEAVAIGLRGDVELRSRAGAVRAVNVRGGRLALDSRAGEVTIERSAARRVEARTAAGQVDVELIRAPLTVDARSRAGQVTVRVPDAGYAVDADTSAGEEDVRVRQPPGARRSIRVRSHAGDVSVQPIAR